MANELDQLNLTQASTLPPELYQQQQALNRQQQMASMLMQQGQQQPQGQMVSGRYVPTSFFQNLQPVANMLTGAYLAKQGDEKAAGLAQALRVKQQEVMQAWASAKTPQEKFALGTSDYAPPQLRAATFEMLKPQKLGEGETIQSLDLGTGQFTPMAQGGQKVAPEIRQAMQLLGINKPLDQLNPQELQAIESKAITFKKAGANNISLTMPSESERKAGTMVTILDRNLKQMQNALGVDPTAVKPNVPASIVEAVAGPNLLSRTITPAQRQIIEDSQLDVLDAALTLRTGAAYTKEQLQGMRDTYFPKIGDKPPAVQAKRQRLESLLEGAYISAGRATPPRVSEPYVAPKPTAPNVNKELNIPASPAAPKFIGFE